MSNEPQNNVRLDKNPSQDVDPLQTADPGREGDTVFDVQICVGEGKEEHIVMCEDDNLHEIARSFCLKHGLDLKQTELIAKKIQEAIEGEKNDTLHQMDAPIREAAQAEEAGRSEHVPSENVDSDEEFNAGASKHPVQPSKPGLATKEKLLEEEKQVPPVSPQREEQASPQQLADNWEELVKKRLREKSREPSTASPKQKSGYASTRFSTASKLSRPCFPCTQTGSPERTLHRGITVRQ